MAAKSVIAMTDKAGRVRLFGPLEPGEASILVSRIEHFDQQKAAIVLPIEDADECDGILTDMEMSGEDMQPLAQETAEKLSLGDLLLRWHKSVELLSVSSCHEEALRGALADGVCEVNHLAPGQDCMAVIGSEMVSVAFRVGEEISPSIQVYTVPVVEGPRGQGDGAQN